MTRWCKIIAGLTLLAAVPSQAWWGHGHGILTRAAVQALPDEMPKFFRQSEETLAHMAYDADLFKSRSVPQLNNAEHGEHFFDGELLEGKAWPDLRYEFLALCAKHGLDPAHVGTLPYSLAEWTQRLAIAFAEYRKWPENEAIRAKCLVYAGMAAHYAQDMVQPLHVTVDFDGRKQKDGSVEGKGIHERVDGVVEKLKLDPAVLAAKAKVETFTELMPAIRAQMDESHALLDQVYALDGALAADEASAAVKAFAQDRGVQAAGFLASLYLWAWNYSPEVKLPGWHQR
jgi:hypothetical protein